MTRINCIPPKLLSDSWLLAEYRELPRISALARIVDDAPKEYVLGTGHVKFFYDKGLYLEKRFESIVRELYERDFNISFTEYRPHPEGLHGDWAPGKKDIEKNIHRLLEKFNEGQKHKYYRESFSKEEFIRLIAAFRPRWEDNETQGVELSSGGTHE